MDQVKAVTSFKLFPLGIALGLAFLGASGAAMAAGNPLQQSISEGAHLFAKESFGGKGMTCASCHTDGGKKAGHLPNGMKIPSLTNAAVIFPRYNPKAGKVVTLGNQINGCIKNGLQGKPLAYNSPQMVAMESYLASLAKGKSMDPGGKPK